MPPTKLGLAAVHAPAAGVGLAEGEGFAEAGAAFAGAAIGGVGAVSA